MGFLLREALRTICGINNNQWSYAVFWKIGCQNPSLLIWEECYYEPTPNSVLPSFYGAENKISSLINRMMLNSRIILVGEGAAGRAAFTGRHQWMRANEFNKDAHPPEVVNELLLNFAAGMQTVAVIPVLPHGVVQMGSSLPVMENLRFVNEVKTLIMQLGHVPGALLSENYTMQDSADFIGVPVSFPAPIMMDPAGISKVVKADALTAEGSQSQINSHNLPYLSGQDCSLLGQSKENMKVGAPIASSTCMTKVITNPTSDGQTTLADLSKAILRKPENGSAAVEVVPANPASWANPRLSSLKAGTVLTRQGTNGYSNSPRIMEQQSLLYTGSQENGTDNTFAVKNSGTFRIEEGKMVNSGSGPGQVTCNADYGNSDPGIRNHMSGNIGCEDLFDMLGIDLKSESLEENWNKLLGHGGSASTASMTNDVPTQMPTQDTSSDLFSVIEGMSLFSGAGTDHLLDAVVSGACSGTKNRSDDSESCKTTLTKVSSSSAQVKTSEQLQGVFGNSMSKAETEGSSSFRPGESVICSQTNSVYGSQISSWVEQAHNLKRESSASTGYSKRNEGSSKSNRKRLKPGESSRPRPKDRQMIQDRVKELREIIPNGAKCSIDALLERTIKHMLFLQSVTKHADKLKQTGESKIIDTEGGPILKDNFEGGATWAFEVGSQSMVCPIAVEDLNPPRGFLVEMLCEERGFFLEIADWIRGLGLTILKGVMEVRNNRIWARFAVEANRDVTRMEIFMLLVQLLEQSVKGGAAPSASNMIVHNSIPQAASIPATGRCQ